MKTKFKAKRVDGKGWVEGFYFMCDWLDKDHQHKIRMQKDKHFIDVSVIPETVCQLIYTDANGNEFYSGDIIEQYNHDSDVYYGGVLFFSELMMQWQIGESGEQFYRFHNPKVTGNIHD